MKLSKALCWYATGVLRTRGSNHGTTIPRPPAEFPNAALRQKFPSRLDLSRHCLEVRYWRELLDPERPTSEGTTIEASLYR